MTSFRLAKGGAIDRSRPLSFTFDGQRFKGFDGDTIASALLANGVAVVGRSFKVHRPRGIWGAGSEEPNALFDVTHGGCTTPNVRATTTPLREGMALRAVNAAPSAARDRKGVLDRLAPFLPAAFYYKTFMWPRWERYEPMIRKMAGLGVLDPHHHPEPAGPPRYREFDVAVVGSGPAGLSAADAAAKRGLSVALIEMGPLGGSFVHRGGAVGDAPWQALVDETVRAVAANGEVLTGAVASGVYDHNLLVAWQRTAQGILTHHIRPKVLVVAAGAIERPLVHANNDRPRVMSADAALAYLERFAVAPGRNVVIATNNDSTGPLADALTGAGISVSVADTRRSDAVTDVRGARGVTAVCIGRQWVDADALLTSGGFTPTVHLYAQAGGRLRYDAERVALVPDGAAAGVVVVGAAAGTFCPDAALAEGARAMGGEPPGRTKPRPIAIQPAWPDPQAKGRAWIDFQNDVTVKDVALAAREGFQSVEHLKRYTTLGMATDQGKTSNVNAIATMAATLGREMDAIGTTRYRPPYVPMPLTALAGPRRADRFNAPRRLPLEAEHRAADAHWREYGGWLRPAWYGSGAGTIAQEVQMAREAVGLFDASPLGKLEVMGPNAAPLVDFNSYNRISTLAVGRARYGLMLTEGGIVYDDGVTLRLADDRFLISASSSHVRGVRLRLEEWRQDRFQSEGVAVHDLTERWATLTLTGPKAREALAACGLKLPQCAPMAHTETRFEGEAMRIARVSFTGDVSFELSVPTHRASALHARLSAGAAAVGGGPIGLEAVLVMRAEKGFIVVGKDTDGTTRPADLQMDGPRLKRQDAYVGKRSLMLPEAQREDRRRLVGLTVQSGEPSLAAGSHVVENGRSVGFVTSSYESPTLGRPIALGLVSRRIGKGPVTVQHLGHQRPATLTDPTAFDPEGARLRD